MSEDRAAPQENELQEVSNTTHSGVQQESIVQQVRRRLPELAALAVTFYLSNPGLADILTDGRKHHGR